MSLRTPVTAAAPVGALALAVSLATSPATAPAVSASPAGDQIIINEVYSNGSGYSGPYLHDFIELYNPGEHTIALDGMAVVVYGGVSGEALGTVELEGEVAGGDHHLLRLQESARVASRGAVALEDHDLDAPDLHIPSRNGSVALAFGDSTLDLVGFGTTERYEGTAAEAAAADESLTRTDRGHGGRRRPEEVRGHLPLLQIAPRDGQTDGVAPRRTALGGPDDVATPPLRRAEALTDGEVAALHEAAVAEVVQAACAGGEGEAELRQHLEGAGRHTPPGWGEYVCFEAHPAHLPGGTGHAETGLVGLQGRELGATSLHRLVETVEDEHPPGLLLPP